MLRPLARSAGSETSLTIVVAASFTADPLSDVIAFWSRELGQPLEVRLAPYNQVFQELLDPGSGTAANVGGLNVIAVRVEDWGLTAGRSLEGAAREAEGKAREFATAVRSASVRLAARMLVCLCPASRSLLGDPEAAGAARRIEASLTSRLRAVPNVKVLTPEGIAAAYPVEAYDLPGGPAHGHLPYSPTFFAALGTIVVRTLRAMTAPPVKVLVLDCDQTLWKGVVGEDGPMGVVVDPWRRNLQEFALAQRAAGTVLCLCSKNLEADVLAVLDGHPDMLLRREHLVAWAINWDAKSDNLRALAKQLNVGMDSVVLLDDNPLECAEVRARCPEAVAIQLPADLRTLPGFLQHLWIFDREDRTEEDSRRTGFYQQNAARDGLLRDTASFADFLASLELDVRIFSPEPRHLARVAQLTQRTNQFNTTTIRRQEPELASLLSSGRGSCLAVEVSDRFGDYGLVGVALFAQDGEALVVDSLLMSCRALGRGVEHRLAARLGEIAEERGLTEVRFPFERTAKNQPAYRFLETIGRAPSGDNGRTVYRLPAGAAASVCYDPSLAAEAPTTAAETSAPRPRVPFRLDDTRVGEIALRLSTADAVHARMQAERRRARPQVATDYVAPRSDLETTLAALWAEALGLDRVGVDDDFFGLGGSSLQATMLVNTMQDALKRSFESIVVFDAPTVAATARLLGEDRGTVVSRIRPAGEATAGVRTGPLSFAQQRLWFLEQFNPGSCVYNERRAIRLRGDLDVRALQGALEALVARHESLRTSFPAVAGRALQRVVPPGPIALSVVDLGPGPEESLLEDATRRVGQELSRPFDLAAGPLVRTGLLRLGPRDHVFWLVFHHIVADGSSVGILLRELASFYTARVGGPAPDLPGLSVQYLDFASWQREAQGGDTIEADRAYWRTQLSGSLPVLELPADHPRPAVLNYRGSRIPWMVPAELVEGLRSIGRREQATLFMTVMAAFQVLLYRHSGQDDVIVGFPIANRSRRELEDVIGFFVNTLPLRTDLSGNPPFAEVVRRVRRGALEAYAHQDIPFEKLVEELVPHRDLARTPIFQVMLALLDDPAGGFELPGLKRDSLEIPVTTTRFDLLLNLEESPAGLVGGLEYSTELFELGTVERMASHLEVLLRAVVSDPERPIHDLPILTGEERRQLLAESSGEAGHFPGATCLHRGFEDRVSRTPEAVALVFEGSNVTYDDLNRRANRLAHHLRFLGVGPDVVVGLCVDRSIDMVVGILGILKAGGAYLPLDPTYPSDRLAFLLEDSAVPVLVTEERHLGDLKAPGAKIVALDRDRDALARCGDGNPKTDVGPEHLAYVIYTSGSTGKPKGALVTHNNVARLFEATQAWYGFGADDVWTLFHSFAFDFSVWELWGALLYGGRLVVVPYWVSRQPEAFHELLRRERVTVLNQTPSAFRQLIQADLASGAPTAELALRTVIFGGEALELQSLRPWFRRYGDARPRLINMYGITETTVHVTYRPVTLADLDGGAGSVIGVAIPDLQVYVLDPGREPTPIGVAGEMYVGGAGLARGYLNRPELTAERFVRDPFDADPNARLYRTGDLARRLAGGDLEYLGRIDLQVKIRGFRIELGEIESVLCQHPAVRETTVIAREDDPGDKRLVAYVVADGGSPETLEELRTLVRAKLPDYMLPAHFVSLAALPLTPHGKVDRKALPLPDPGRRATSRPYAPPRTPAEETMAGIWATVLRIERVGIDDNFFELGGDSILSIQVVARCRANCLVVSPRDLFRTPTIAALAAGAGGKLDAAADEGPVEGAVPLTPIQRWFFEQDVTDVHHWNQAFLFETPADLDVDVLERALHEVVRHHDALRLRFTRSPSGWHQEYGPEPPGTSITRVDLSAVQAADRSAAISSRATALGGRLNVTDGPLLRAAHFDLGPDDAGRFLLVVHHLVVDGVSWRILLEDLESAYLSLRERRSVTLPGKTTSFGRWAECLAAHAASEVLGRARDHWRSVVEADALPLPVDHPGGDNLEGTAELVLLSLDVEETETLLRDVPATYGTRINDVLLTALARGLSVWTGRHEFRIELEGHGREDLFDGIDVSRTVGWFTAIYPVRLEIAPGQDDGAALRSVRDQLRKVPDKGMSFGLLPELAPAHPLADLIFNYLGQFDQVVAGSTLFAFAAEGAGAWHSPRARRTHALEVLVRVAAGRLEIQWIFCPHVHDRETIERVAASLALELRGLIRHCRVVADRRLAATPNAEDRYPLSPMQRLFHSMEAGSSGIGYEEWRFAIDGEVDAQKMRRAWDLLLKRHTILRTAFVVDGAEEPLQVVLREAVPPWREEDLRGMGASAQDDRVREILRIERESGFDLSVAPLMRVALVRVAERRYEMLWATHHLYVDGWSWPVLIGDLSEIYGALCGGREPSLPPACPYGRYVRWLEEESPDSESFWKQELAGFRAPTPLDLDPALPSSAGSAEPGEVAATLAAPATEALTAFARGGQTTISIAVQGAWALLLAHMSGSDDVVLGAAFSGRPAEIEGVEGMVGPCVNNVPVRVRVQGDESAAAYVARLQRKQPELSHHQFAPLSGIQEWAGVPWRLRLFESLIVFQNYVVGDEAKRLGRDAAVRLIHGPDATKYPLTLVVVPGPEMRLKILFQRNRFTQSRAEGLAADLAAVLTAMGATPEATVGSILRRLPAETCGRAAAIAVQRSERPPSAFAAPGTALERTVAKVWADLFQVGRVGLDDNFFDLGGHSLLLLEAHRRLREQVRAGLPVVALFQYPTVRSLARFLGGQAGEAKSRGAQDRAQKQKEALSRMKSAIGRKR